MTPIVLIGWDVRDAQGLAMRRRQQDRGRRVRLLSCNTRYALQGMRLTEAQVEATERARQHPRWPEIERELALCQIRTGAPTP